MKIDLLQFIKKLNFAVRLAKYDCLFILEPFRAFRFQLPIARLFEEKKDLLPLEKLNAFLSSEANSYLTMLFNETAARSDLLKNEFYYFNNEGERLFSDKALFKQITDNRDIAFYNRLIQEIIALDVPRLQNQWDYFQRLAELQGDMRFYGAELEHLTEYTNSQPSACCVSVEWSLTDKPELYLDLGEPVVYTQQLSQTSQQNLVKLWTYLFFEKSVFISNYNGIAVDSLERVNFIDFDYLYNADSAMRSYLYHYLADETPPSSHLEFKLQHSFRLLQTYCPSVDLPAAIKECYDKYPLEVPFQVTQSNAIMEIYSKQGMLLQPRSDIAPPNFDSLSGLLDPSKHRKDSRYKKSSFFYYFPLLILIYILWKYF